MGQIEVYEFLKEKRECGNNEFMTCKQVELACKDKGFSSGMLEGVRGDLLRLELSGYLEAMIESDGWKRAWRIKMKYVKKVHVKVKHNPL